MMLRLISLITLIGLIASISVASMVSADNRDDFPGRRQGGGTHWFNSPELKNNQ